MDLSFVSWYFQLFPFTASYINGNILFNGNVYNWKAAHLCAEIEHRELCHLCKIWTSCRFWDFFSIKSPVRENLCTDFVDLSLNIMIYNPMHESFVPSIRLRTCCFCYKLHEQNACDANCLTPALRLCSQYMYLLLTRVYNNIVCICTVLMRR